MKIYHLSLIIYLLSIIMLSCHSRKVALEKHEEKTEIQEEKTEQTTTESTANFSIKKDFNVFETLDNVEYIYIRDYHENGTLKSERKEARAVKQETKSVRQEEEKTDIRNSQTIEKTDTKTEKKSLKTKEKTTEKENSFFHTFGIFTVIALAIWLLIKAVKGRVKI